MKYNALYKPRSEQCAHMYKAYISREQWNKLIANPRIILDKHTAPLLIWGRMVDNPERANNGYPRCTGDNVGALNALQVDVDDGCKMDEFVKCFHRYKFELYTSYSYGVFKPGDRYRVIFPLAEPIETSWLVPPVKDILMHLFDMCDMSCFDRGHFQIIPCISSKDAPYKFMQHDGELLSFKLENFGKIAMEYSEDFHWKREIAEADRDPNANHAGALKYVQEVFDKTEIGSRDRVVYSKLMFLKDTVGCTYDEVIGLRPPVGFDEEYVAKVNRLYLGR